MLVKLILDAMTKEPINLIDGTTELLLEDLLFRDRFNSNTVCITESDNLSLMV
jgi:hypothetical protein